MPTMIDMTGDLTNRERLLDAFKGCVMGHAIGDALGHPVEFLDRRTIIEKYGELGAVTSFQPPTSMPAGSFTDDTQMALAIMEALIDVGDKSLPLIMDKIAANFILWERDKTTYLRAPGNTCLSGVKLLQQGLHWSESGQNNSKGCGTAMRTPPIGLAYLNNIRKLFAVAKYSSEMTHGNSAAAAGGIAVAYGVSLAVRQTPVNKWPELMADIIKPVCQQTSHYIRSVPESLALEEWRAVEKLGKGWTADEAVGVALHAFLRGKNNFTKVMDLAVNHDGDSDSTGCIAGAWYGAFHGVSKLPPDLVRDVEDSDLLMQKADKLFQRTFDIIH